MTIEVTAPDGSVVEFPDGTSPGVIRGAMHAHAGGQTAPGSAAHGIVDTGVDMARGAWGGLVGSVAGLAQAPAAIEDAKDTALNAAGNAVFGMFGLPPSTVAEDRARNGPMAIAPGQQLRSVAQTANANAGGGYVPHTTAGRYAHAVGAAVPNALFPEGMPAKVAATVIPGVLGQFGSDTAAHFGAPPAVQEGASILGNVVGGGVAGVKDILDDAAYARGAAIPKAQAPVARAVSSALAIGKTDPAALRTSLANGVLPVAADPGLTQLGEAVATVPGPGQITLRTAAAARRGTQTDRAMSAMQQHLGVDPTAARGGVDTIVANGRAAAKPLYDSIRADPSPVWNPELAALAERPAIKKAIGVVSNNMLNSGQDPTAAGIALDPDTGAPSIGTDLGSMVENQPTAATWVGVHQALGQTVERNPLTGRVVPNSISPGNFDISVAGNDLKSALAGDGTKPGAIPGYGDALATSGDYLSTQGAYDKASGQLFNGPVYDFSKMWSSLGTPSEQAAGQAGLANDVLEASDRGRFEPGLFKSPGVQAKLAIAFGDQPASDFTDQMEADGNERDAYNQILGNSRTASRQALIDQYAADNPPSGIAGLASKGLGAAEWIQSAFHPALLATKLARSALGATGAGKEAAMPWSDPATNAQLGDVLSDPLKFTSLLDQLDKAAAAPSVASAWRGGILGIPQIAAPGIVGGVLGVSPVAAPAVNAGVLTAPAAPTDQQSQQ